MKVLSILGSPRKKGTSSRIAKSFTTVAEQNGAEVQEFYLNGMNYKGCQGCEKCHSKDDKCILKDDLTPVLDGMREADIIVYSTPVYYLDVSGQFKTFLDRTWSHIDYQPEKTNPYISRLPEGKTVIFVVTQADVEENQRDVVERQQLLADLYGYDFKVIRAAGLSMGSPDEDVSTFEAEATKLAQELIPINS
ncbi:flavodoxin family protein [Desulfovibrio sp. JC010]|uniref:flavodoxin family protein n=1 Tax=Desulfovibrio sp. JC010 TaxID=2593641 RepID=UPI0013D01563|nr:flavodoxin family protein [Desulfovibrio sp. JC010]NDV27538.1 flavodoxin family protein [Desulfovibrio sp. JC010]